MSLTNRKRLLSLILVFSCFASYAQAGIDELNSSLQAKLAHLSTTQFEEPLIATTDTTPEEDAALLSAIEKYQHRSSDDDYRALTDFLVARSESGWQVSLLTNLGLSYYRAGRFSLAIDSWEKAWRLGKSVSEPKAKMLVDRALGELMRMHARIGHTDQLDALFAELGDRPVTGPATELVTNSREGLWMMRNRPEISFLCGPMALKNLLLSQGADEKHVQFLNDFQSPPQGVSLAEVDQLARQARFNHQLIYREPGQTVPVPSIIHWKVNHYAAIVDASQGHYHIKDPTFGEDLWISKAAIDAESSGYFLVKDTKKRKGWRQVQLAEAENIRGMGNTGNSMMASATKPSDDKAKPEKCDSSHGMCDYNIHEMLVSLNPNDTPVGYASPKGPAVYIKLTYNQREAGQPANFSYFNVGPKWTLNWLSYIEDNPTIPGANVIRRVAGGGSVNYTGYKSSTGMFTRETDDASLLVRKSSNPVIYERQLVDGSREIYSQSNGATAAPRRIFLTQVIDAQGNSVRLNYDTQMRLTTISDATERNTLFAYEHAGNPLLITKITDPFGRSAVLNYDANKRLIGITDVIGLTSSFHYNSSSLIDSMTTPYGTTTFVFGESGSTRWLNATDPLGHTERVEYRHQAPGIPYSEATAKVPQGMGALTNLYLYWRNTFYWDKEAYQLGVGNYTKARLKHWHHLTGASIATTANSLESIKYPLENRVWYKYLGQASSIYSGSLNKPTHIGRVLDDGATQITQISYNSLGHPTHLIDPLGRDTQIDYATNQIDVVRLSQKTATNSYSTLAEFTYNSQHLPLTYKDAAGQTTTYSYNSAGQLIAVKDALNQITDYAYDNLGYLTQITNANDKTELSLAYDSLGRVTSRTDSEGYTLSYSYDDFDRVTQVSYPDGTVETASWDKLDLASITDRQGRTTQYSYDAVRNLIASIDPLNRKIQYGYYPNQNLKNLIDANGQITTWNRDLQSRVTAKVYADGHQETQSYETTTSRLKTLTDSLGQSKRYNYAKDNRPTKLEYLNAINATPTVSFSYDPWFPRVTSMTDGTGTTQYQYQALGTPGALNLKQTDGPYLNDTIAYQYDALGRISQRSVDSSSESFDYDALSRVVTHTNPLGSFTHTYLGETGQLTGLQHSNGRVSTHWSYDDNAHDRHLLGIQNSGSTRSYDYETTTENLISQIHEISTGNRARPSKDWTYGYDTVDRLETVQTSDGAQYSYEYDVGDNLTAFVSPTSTTDFTVNSLNQVADANGVAYSYDANGNLKDDGIRTYQWDADNRLLKIDYKPQPSRNTQFRYDGLGRRVAIISKNGTMTTENRYLWCGDNLCQSRMATDVVNWRSYPQGEIRPLGNTLLYFSRDHLGSVRDVLTVQAGVRIATYDYDAYGNPTYAVGRLSTNFRYAGMFYLEEAGLYLTQYRVYDPNTGRWLSRDPIGEMGGVNLYGYVGGNPVNNTDSSGLIIDTLADAGFILYDLYKLASEGGCERNTNLTALGLDIVGAISPGVTGLGVVSRSKSVGAVIGRMDDLRAPGALRSGEYTIADRLPNLGNPKANYYQNMSVLREEMRNGIPIRDLSGPDKMLAPTKLNPNRTIRQTFTGAERNQLRNKGWTYDGEFWNPKAR